MRTQFREMGAQPIQIEGGDDGPLVAYRGRRGGDRQERVHQSGNRSNPADAVTVLKVRQPGGRCVPCRGQGGVGTAQQATRAIDNGDERQGRQIALQRAQFGGAVRVFWLANIGKPSGDPRQAAHPVDYAGQVVHGQFGLP